MAASFKLGNSVKLNVAPPQGEVVQLAVDQEGNIQYLVEFIGADGNSQQRWFKEEELVGV